jgi:hypothetical protein
LQALGDAKTRGAGLSIDKGLSLELLGMRSGSHGHSTSPEDFAFANDQRANEAIWQSARERASNGQRMERIIAPRQ